MKIFENPSDTSTIENIGRFQPIDIPETRGIEVERLIEHDDTPSHILPPADGYRVTTPDGQINDFPRSPDAKVRPYRKAAFWVFLWTEFEGLPLVDELDFFPKEIVAQTKPYQVVYATLVPKATANEVAELFDITTKTISQYYNRIS